MERADYSKIADFYDDGRSLSARNEQMWLDLILERSAAGPGAEVLDLGCGTGRFSLPMARRLGFAVTGADASREMLAKAQAKDTGGEVTWNRQDAGCLTYPDARFDVVFLSHLLHRITRPEAAIAECYRVLRPAGRLLVRYGAAAQIMDDVEHALFPEVAAIDKGRMPSVEDTEQWLRGAGFGDVALQEIVQQTYADGQAHLRAAVAKSTSVLTMISPEAFAEGLQRLEQHVRTQPDDLWLRFDRMTLTVGCKSGKARG